MHAVISISIAREVGSFSVSIPAVLTFHRSKFEVPSIMEMPGLGSRDCVSRRDCCDRISSSSIQGENVSRLYPISASRPYTMAALTSYITRSPYTSSCYTFFISWTCQLYHLFRVESYTCVENMRRSCEPSEEFANSALGGGT